MFSRWLSRAAVITWVVVLAGLITSCSATGSEDAIGGVRVPTPAAVIATPTAVASAPVTPSAASPAVVAEEPARITPTTEPTLAPTPSPTPSPTPWPTVEPISIEAGLCTYADQESAARIWNEQALEAIRGDLPAPTIVARNLFHFSAAMYDAWAAWDPAAQAVFISRTDGLEPELNAYPGRIEGGRYDAITFAAYRMLTTRYENSETAEETLERFDATLAEHCLVTDPSELEPNSAARFGWNLAGQILDTVRFDNSAESLGYNDQSYQTVNAPLWVETEGIEMADPARWQPLALAESTTQNGISLDPGVQNFITPHWGVVDTFAIEQVGDALPIDPGPPPLPLTDPEGWFLGIEDVLRFSSQLQVGSAEINMAPRGTNPVTGEPYAPNPVDRADWLRAIAEYWADGPTTETPPGHWNLIANQVGDDLADRLQIGGNGIAVRRLEWDIKMYLSLNGANHDTAVAVWGSKERYDYPRPISMIRYSASLGQSTNDSRPDYNPLGLPLIDGLIEVLTTDHIVDGDPTNVGSHLGEIGVYAWRGPVDDGSPGGVAWMPAINWLPYQRPDFVSPAFAGYVSGHSAFSEASAIVLAEFTGDEYFPGGLYRHTVEPGFLRHEDGPSQAVELQWATYADASTEAGLSRRPGGIHPPADDLAGRAMGATVGDTVWEHVTELWSATEAG